MFSVSERGIAALDDFGGLRYVVTASVIGEKNEVGVLEKIELDGLVKDASNAGIHVRGHGRELGHVVFASRFDRLHLLESRLVVEDVEMHCIVRYLQIKREVSGVIAFYEVQGLVRDGIDSFWVLGSCGTACVFGSAGKVSGIAIRKIVSLLVWTDSIVPMVPFSEMSSLIVGIGRLQHSRNI